MSQHFKYSYKETRKENTGLNVYNSGLQQCEPYHKWGPAVRDHYLLHYVATGKGEYQCGRHSWKLQAGELFLSYPDTVIRYEADGEEPWEYFWVGFQGADTRWLLERTAFSPEKPVLHGDPSDSTLQTMLVEIYNARGTKPANDAAMTGRLYLLLSHIMQQYPAARQEAAPGREYFDQAVQHIAGTLGQPLTVQQLADSIGLSRSQLYRVFIAQSGKTPVEFLNEYRINRAAGLLREKGLTVAQASASVGFGDPLYFSRIFKRIKGIPPGQYR